MPSISIPNYQFSVAASSLHKNELLRLYLPIAPALFQIKPSLQTTAISRQWQRESYLV